MSKEDIKILERVVEIYYDCADNRESDYDMRVDMGFMKKEAQAIENLLKSYKELEEERQLVGMPVRNKRDDVDLKELEKFEFRKYEYTHLLVLRKKEHDFASIDIRNRRYEILDLCNLTYNLTYDLTKEGLVVKE